MPQFSKKMCGRYQLSVTGKQISERYNVEVYDEMYSPSYNCAPYQYLPVITNENRGKISFMRWGLLPSWYENKKSAIKLINARGETLGEKPLFKQAFEKRRCIIPANGFYEWKRGKYRTPYRFYLKNEKIFSIAGIWERRKNRNGDISETFLIITTAPNELIKPVHNRMPLILNREAEKIWVSEKDTIILKKLIKPYPANEMSGYEISNRINSVRSEGEVLIKPAGEQGKLF